MSSASVMDSPAIERAVSYPPKSRRSSGTISKQDMERELPDIADNSLKSSDNNLNASSLPPVDTGYAWVFLSCAFTAE